MAGTRVYATRTRKVEEMLEAAPGLGVEARGAGATLVELAEIGFEVLRAEREQLALEEAYRILAADEARTRDIEILAQATVDAGLL